MNKKLVFHTIGKLMLMEAAFMLPSLAVSLIERDGYAWAFLAALGAILLVSVPQAVLIKPEDRTMYTRDGMAIAGLSWVCMSVMGCLPLVFAGICGFADAFFEIASGFTTTGASVLPNLESLPRSIHFLRCFTHWVGGMGVLVLTTAVLPGAGGGAPLAKAESSGPSFSKLVPKLGDNSKALYIIYTTLTALLFIALLLCGMDGFDSLIHALSTAGTGGFSNKALSIGHYDSLSVDIVISVFMLLFGISFAVYFRLFFSRDVKGALKNQELWIYLGLCALFTVLIAFNISSQYGGFAKGLRYSFFQVSSLVSTTGFGTADFELWPAFSKALLFLLMLVGSCAGSTAGGLKLIRAILLVKLAGREITRSFKPRSVKVIKLDGKSVPEDMLGHIAVFFFVYCLIAVCGTIAMALSGCDLLESISGSVACISNIGPAFGRLGPMGGFGFLPPVTKVIMALIMLAGRLEFYPLLMLLFPAAWRKN
jgi:trk system potassium uptake protein TrkH